MIKLKAAAKQFTPPVLYRAIRSVVRAGQVDVNEEAGRERGPGWYDESFVESAHWASHYSESPYYFLWTVISDRIIDPRGRTVLDVGCGSGQLASLLRDKGVERYCGIDFSPKRIAQAKKTCPGFRFDVADAFETGLFDDYRYDTVISTEFLEHVTRDLYVIQKLREGTHFIGTVPNFPFESHVRHFEDCEAVSDRYAQYFRNFRVDAFLADKDGKTLFILEGIKRGDS